jgi:hypothetical protein
MLILNKNNIIDVLSIIQPYSAEKGITDRLNTNTVNINFRHADINTVPTHLIQKHACINTYSVSPQKHNTLVDCTLDREGARGASTQQRRAA